MYYASFGLLALVIHLIINFNILKTPKSKSSILQWRYKSFLNAVMVYYIADILWGFLSDLKILALVYADTVIYFTVMLLSVLLWTRYVVSYLNKDNSFSTIMTISGWAIFIFEIVILIINFFYPIVFYFDENVDYHPGTARYVTLGILMILYLLTACHTLIVALKGDEISRLHHKTIGFSGLMMIVFIVLQAMYPMLPFYAIGCILTTCLIHAFIIEEHMTEHSQALNSAKHMALTDSLTGIKNSHAYAESVKTIEQRIKNDELFDFGLIVFDLNGLKQINDTFGHEAGNQYIKDACHLICEQFKHSPVYRIGGDEFVVFLEGSDFTNRENLIDSFEKQIEQNQIDGTIVISEGYSEYHNGEDDYNAVFDRADKKMYERKKALKAR